MLPNHAPLVVAEQFRTLATLYADRIDLGVGGAPGTDIATARALRRHMVQEDSFSQDVLDLIGYFDDMPDGTAARAIPGSGTHVPVWILASSIYGAQLAAYLGLPYAFAAHFAPAMLEEVRQVYRATFKSSRTFAAPYVMLAAGGLRGRNRRRSTVSAHLAAAGLCAIDDRPSGQTAASGS
jgi:luciferase family oxidoreductase group 1